MRFFKGIFKNWTTVFVVADAAVEVVDFDIYNLDIIAGINVDVLSLNHNVYYWRIRERVHV